MTGRFRERLYDAYYSTTFRRANPATDEDYRMRARILRQVLLPHLPAAHDARILDLACGNGYAVHMLREAGYTGVLGVDVSGEQVELARRRGLPVEQGDAFRTLQAESATCDAILALDFIEHLDRDELLEFFDRARAALKPGGRLVVKTANANSPIAARLRWGDLTHEQLFTENSLRAAFEVCRLKPLFIGGQRYRPFTASGWARLAVASVGRWFWGLYLIADLGREGVGVATEFDLVGVAEPA
jgi:SAM-dependent methyltransferase